MDSFPEVTVSVHSLLYEAERFFRSAKEFLDFGPREVCMEIGCGSGYSTRNFLTVFPDIKKVIAIDKVPNKIDDAKIENPHDKVEYRVADILDWSSVVEWHNSIPKIVSFYCFHHIKRQPRAFTNVYCLLKPGGAAAICMQLNSPYFNVIEEVAENPKWKEYIKDDESIVPESHIMKFQASDYRKILENIGFEVILCKQTENIFTFTTPDECRRILASMIPTKMLIPSDQGEEFMNYVFKIHSDHSHPLTMDGLFYMKQCVISIFVKRPL